MGIVRYNLPQFQNVYVEIADKHIQNCLAAYSHMTAESVIKAYQDSISISPTLEADFGPLYQEFLKNHTDDMPISEHNVIDFIIAVLPNDIAMYTRFYALINSQQFDIEFLIGAFKKSFVVRNTFLYMNQVPASKN